MKKLLIAVGISAALFTSAAVVAGDSIIGEYGRWVVLERQDLMNDTIERYFYSPPMEGGSDKNSLVVNCHAGTMFILDPDLWHRNHISDIPILTYRVDKEEITSIPMQTLQGQRMVYTTDLKILKPLIQKFALSDNVVMQTYDGKQYGATARYSLQGFTLAARKADCDV